PIAVGTAGARDEVAAGQRYDRRAVRVAKRNDAPGVPYRALEQGEHEPGAGGGEGGKQREAILPGVFRRHGATREAALASIHDDRIAAVQLGRLHVELGIDAVEAAVGEHLEELVQALPFFARELRVLLHLLARFDDAAGEILV